MPDSFRRQTADVRGTPGQHERCRHRLSTRQHIRCAVPDKERADIDAAADHAHAGNTLAAQIGRQRLGRHHRRARAAVHPW